MTVDTTVTGDDQSITSIKTMLSPKNSKTKNLGQNFWFVRTLIFDGYFSPAEHKVWCNMPSANSKIIIQSNKILNKNQWKKEYFYDKIQTKQEKKKLTNLNIFVADALTPYTE